MIEKCSFFNFKIMNHERSIFMNCLICGTVPRNPGTKKHTYKLEKRYIDALVQKPRKSENTNFSGGEKNVLKINFCY